MKVELSKKQVEVLKGTLKSYLKVLDRLGGKKGLPGGRKKYKEQLKEILTQLKKQALSG